MKLLGLIGGVSPESTELYYRLLNAGARQRLGADHSAKLIISSFDFAEMVAPYNVEDWSTYIRLAVDAAERLKAAGAEALLICSNTTHISAEKIKEVTDLPLIHLLDVLAASIVKQKSSRPLLLGTPATMNGNFYRPYLVENHNVNCIIPDRDDQEQVDRIIFDELCNGIVLDTSREIYLDIINRSRDAGCDSVILGCTEIALLIEQQHTDIPVFDTTRLHAAAASRFAFGEDV